MSHVFSGAMVTTGEVTVVDDAATAMNHTPSVTPLAMAEGALIDDEATGP